MIDDITIRLTDLRPAYSRDGVTKVLAVFDLELSGAIRLRRCRLACNPHGYDLLMPERAGAVAVIDNEVRAAVIRAARQLYDEQRPGALVA